MKHKEIVEKMSLEQKAAFVSGYDYWHLEEAPELGLPKIMITDGPHGLRKQENVRKRALDTAERGKTLLHIGFLSGTASFVCIYCSTPDRQCQALFASSTQKLCKSCAKPEIRQNIHFASPRISCIIGSGDNKGDRNHE